MPDSFDKDTIIKTNPMVDPEKLEELEEHLKKIHTITKMRKADYNLASPINRRKVSIGRDERGDSRTIHVNPARNRR